MTCPVCERPVVIRIPKRRAHHAAHAPGDSCPVTRPETALHVNVKFHIAAQLQQELSREGGRRTLRVLEGCAVGRADLAGLDDPPAPGIELRVEGDPPRCAERRELPWIACWDSVQLERRIVDSRDPSRVRVPDVLLRNAGTVVAAIEVYHSHAVSDAKAAALAALGVPWVEVLADERLLVGGTTWTLDSPLPAHRLGPTSEWRCAAHEAARAHARAEAARRREEADRRAEAEREAARHGSRICAVKLADVLYPSGKVWRNVYTVLELSTDGVPHTIVLTRGDTTLLELALDPARKRELWARIGSRVTQDLAAVEALRRARTDSPMGWARGALAERMASALERPGVSRRVPLEQTHRLRYSFDESSRKWFVPDELRDVCWDRPDDDPLDEPHPIWLQRRSRFPASLGTDQESGTRRATPAGGSPWRAPLTATAFGSLVSDVVEHDYATVFCLCRPEGRAEREYVIVTPARAIVSGKLRELDRFLVASGVERLWLSHRTRWTRDLADVPWLPLVAGADGRHAVPVAGLAVPVTELAAAFAAGAPHLTPDAVLARRAAMSLDY